MTTNELPSPPTFSQMMEDLRIMSADEKIFQLDPIEQSETIDENSVEHTHRLINEFLARLDTLQRLDTSLSTQNNSVNDQLKKKLEDLIKQLEMCLKKLQTKSYSKAENLMPDNKK